MNGHKQHWLFRVRPAFVASVLKRWLRIQRRVVEVPGGRFFLDPASNFGDAILSKNLYEPEMVAALQHLLRRGDSFIDLGANEGYFSVLASRQVGESGKVVTIEPQSRLQSVIFRNLQENGARNVVVLQCAVSDRVGTATLSLLPDMNTGGSGLFRNATYRVPTEAVPQTTLSQLFNFLNVGRIKLLKMDIEGSEYEAILGSRQIFESGQIEHIALELHPTILHRLGKPVTDILDCLKSCGYEQNPDCRTLVLSKQVA